MIYLITQLWWLLLVALLVGVASGWTVASRKSK